MAGSSSPNITPKEEPVTLDRLESPNLFLPATQVEFTFDEITFTTNNEVALIYLSHSNQEYFMAVLPDSKIWVSTPTGEVKREIGYNREIGAKGTLKKSCLPPRWRLLMGQIIQCLDVLVDSKAPKYSSLTEEVPQGKNPGARSKLRRKQSLKHTSESTTEASNS
ncbi:hypothetical protein Tco_0432386 [Tanacetum coccineum]